LDSAGFLTINHNSRLEHDICVLDWNSTGLGEFDYAKLTYYIYVLLNKKIVPVFLIFKTIHNIRNRKAERQVIELSKKLNLPLLDLRPETDIDKHTRDKIHTNVLGAELAAEIILEFLKKEQKNNYYKNIIKPLAQFEEVFNIDIINLKGTILNKNTILNIENIRPSKNAELWLYLTIGPNSASIIVSTKKDEKEIEMIDQWCFYERKVFKKLPIFWETTTDQQVMIKLSNCKPDLSKIKKPIVTVEEKYIQIHSLYVVNAKVNIRNEDRV